MESNWAQQLVLKHNDIVTAKRWKAALPHMFICKDTARMFWPARTPGQHSPTATRCLKTHRKCLTSNAYTHPPPLPPLRTTTGMDYASIPQPTAGPLSEDLIPKEVSRRGSFFGSFQKSLSFQTNSQVGEEAVGHSSAADAGVASVAAFEGQTHEQDEDSKEEKGEVVPSTTSVDARDDEGNCITCGFPEPSSTSDHRQQGSTKSPEWKTHVMMWLSEAVKSIPAYVERSTIVLVRIEKKKRR